MKKLFAFAVLAMGVNAFASTGKQECAQPPAQPQGGQAASLIEQDGIVLAHAKPACPPPPVQPTQPKPGQAP